MFCLLSYCYNLYSISKYLMGERGSGVGYSGEGGHLAGASE